MQRPRVQSTSRQPGTFKKKIEPLSESKYQDLLKDASAFFAMAECDEHTERAAIIVEIRETMARYGLTADDLR